MDLLVESADGAGHLGVGEQAGLDELRLELVGEVDEARATRGSSDIHTSALTCRGVGFTFGLLMCVVSMQFQTGFLSSGPLRSRVDARRRRTRACRRRRAWSWTAG